MNVKHLRAAALAAIALPGVASAQMCATPPGGLVSWWSGDGNTIDIGAAGNHGTLEGTATFAAGLVGEAFSFDGAVENFVRVPNAPSLEPADVTVEGWVRSDGTPGQFKYVAAKGAQGCEVASYAFYTGDTGGLFFYVSDGTEFVRSPDAGVDIWDGEWHHIAGSYDGQLVKLYVDGVEVGNGNLASFDIAYGLSASNDLIIGQYGGEGVCPASVNLAFTGEVDELSVYNVALTLPDIEDIADAADAGKCREETVTIDINPRSDANTVRMSRASYIRVGILSSTDFDALMVDSATIELTAPELSLETHPDRTAVCREWDINRDGLTDLFCWVPTVRDQLVPGETVAELTASTFDDLQITGQDTLRIVLDPVLARVDQDAWIAEEDPTAPHPDSFSLSIQKTEGAEHRGLLRFDLSSIPQGATVRSAYALFRATGGDWDTINFFPVTDDWSESTANWANTAADYDAETVAGSFMLKRGPSFYLANFTSQVQDWVCGAPNNGLMMMSETDYNETRIASRDTYWWWTRPRMIVRFGYGPSPCEE